MAKKIIGETPKSNASVAGITVAGNRLVYTSVTRKEGDKPYHYLAYAIIDVLTRFGATGSSCSLETICSELIAMGQVKKPDGKLIVKYLNEMLEFNLATLNADSTISLVTSPEETVDSICALYNKAWTAVHVKKG
jgi:hypothetical protein